MCQSLSFTLYSRLPPYPVNGLCVLPMLQLQRLSTDKNKQKVWRAWRSLCEHTAAACAADAAIASATAESFKTQAFGSFEDSRSLRTGSNEVFSTAENKEQSRQKLLLFKTVSECPDSRQ